VTADMTRWTRARFLSAVAKRTEAFARFSTVAGERGSAAKDDDFEQAGALYRLMTEPEKERLVANIAASLSRVSRDDIITRSIAHLRNADADFGAHVQKAIRARRAAH
jgi:catalase